MRKVGVRILMIFAGVFVILFVYILWDNNRVTITDETIPIANLPSEFEGFSILQITDLHEKYFGKNQKRLLKKINGMDYDVIVFTGDMLNEKDSTNVSPFYTLLEGIENKEHAFFVRGNDDPESYTLSSKLEKSPFIQGIEERGVTFLESIDTIEKKGAVIHFVNFELSIVKAPENIGRINGTVQPGYVTDDRYFTYQKERWDQLDVKRFSNDVVIAINHYPVVDERVDYIEDDPNTQWRDIDLILAGHYHGGQFRLPFIGALFVPEPWYEPNSFFPPQDRVKGLWEYNETKQYVSAGLGSSADIPFLKFRLFNTPEINVLKLTKQ